MSDGSITIDKLPNKETFSDADILIFGDEGSSSMRKATFSAVKQNIKNSIPSVGTEGVVIPSYVMEESKEASDKVLDVRDAYSFVFGAFSDSHTDGVDVSASSIQHAGMGMNEINKRTQLDALLNFGDVMRADFTDSYIEGFPYVKTCFDNVIKGVPYIQMQGNHDEYDQSYSEDEEKQKYFAYIGANNIDTVTDWNNRFRNYGYRDFESQKFRVIYLNSVDMTTIETSETPISTDCHISGEQFKWFINNALDFSNKEDAENWSFIVCTHHDLNWYAWNNASPMLKLLAVLDAYKGKTSGSVVSDGITTQYDFANVKATFIAHFHGHLHNFRHETLGTNGVLTITIPNACYDRNNEYGTSSSYSDTIHELCGDVDSNGNQRQFNKTSGTAEDTSFNVVVVDRTNLKIHCINYGAGIDREIDFDGSIIEPDEPIEPDTPPTGGYTNVIDSVGYTDDVRISTSTPGTTKEATGFVTTGIINLSNATKPVTIRTKGVDFSNAQSAVTSYNSSGTATYGMLVSNLIAGATTEITATLDSDNNLTMVISASASDAYSQIQLCGYGKGSELIVTLNEQIK